MRLAECLHDIQDQLPDFVDLRNDGCKIFTRRDAVVLLRRCSQVPGKRFRGFEAVKLFKHPHAGAGICGHVNDPDLLSSSQTAASAVLCYLVSQPDLAG